MQGASPVASDPSPARSRPSAGSLLSTAEVARRLGVKPQTVYAYVSRGLLRPDAASSHRNSLFTAEEVERLASRARRPGRSDALEVVIETELTALDPGGRLHYRGRDAIELARFRSFEDVAGLLWDGDPQAPWELAQDDRGLIASVRAAMPASARPVDLIPVAVAALGAADDQRADRRPEAVRRAAGRMIAGALEVITSTARPEDRSAGAPSGGANHAPTDPPDTSHAGGASQTPTHRSAAARLWRAVRADGRRPRPAQSAALNAALVLLADHELAASTLAARVAASAWADPYRVVLAGLGPLGGALHGGAGLAVEALLAQAGSPAGPFVALDGLVAAGSASGFGHRVYRGPDPRAAHLLERLPSVSDDAEALRTVETTLEAARSLGLPPPNVDFGLAALGLVMKLRPGSASTIFTLARIVGMTAHALEEYPHRLRFRPRATYTGPTPP